MGVNAARGSRVMPTAREAAPASFPLKYSGLPDMPRGTEEVRSIRGPSSTRNSTISAGPSKLRRTRTISTLNSVISLP